MEDSFTSIDSSRLNPDFDVLGLSAIGWRTCFASQDPHGTPALLHMMSSGICMHLHILQCGHLGYGASIFQYTLHHCDHTTSNYIRLLIEGLGLLYSTALQQALVDRICFERNRHSQGVWFT